MIKFVLSNLFVIWQSEKSYSFLNKILIMRMIIQNGEMAEWSKAHAWKVCVLQKGTKGSNPFLSANNK